MIEINGKIYRNLQEQVAENVKDIADLQEAVEDLPDNTYSRTQIDSKDAAVLTEAKGYADQKSAAAVTEAKAYTDTEISSTVKVIKLLTYPTTLTEEQQYDFEHYDVLIEYGDILYMRSSVDPIRFKPVNFYLYYETNRLVTNIFELTYQQDGTIYADLLQNANITQPLALASDLAAKQDHLTVNSGSSTDQYLRWIKIDDTTYQIPRATFGKLDIEYGTTSVNLTLAQRSEMFDSAYGFIINFYSLDQIDSHRINTYYYPISFESTNPQYTTYTYRTIGGTATILVTYDNQNETLAISYN